MNLSITTPVVEADSVLELVDIFAKVKRQLHEAAACELDNTDYEKYIEAVQKTGDFDGDQMVYETTVRLEFLVPIQGFKVRFEADVWVGNEEMTIENIEISDYLIVE